MLPAACPRCNRPNSEWTIERPEARAGCPCGEVIAVTFDDELNVLELPVLSAAPKKPQGWVEQARMDGWRATLVPSRKMLWVAAITFVPLLLREALVGAALRSFVLPILFVGALVLFAAALFAYRLQRWSFAFEAGRFKVDARGLHEDVALNDIVGFVAAPVPRKEPTRLKTAGGFQLRVLKTGGASITVPLFVNDASEAQFIADRANALLASGGREGNFGYRGEPLRVEAEEPHVRVALEQEEPESEDASPARRQAR